MKNAKYYDLEAKTLISAFAGKTAKCTIIVKEAQVVET